MTTTAPVDVEGTPLVSLFLGSGGGSWRGAEYLTGSGSYDLVFRYRVQSADFDEDGVSVSAAAVADDRTAAYGFTGNIFFAGTDVPMNYTHPGVSGHWKQRVDGRPYVQNTEIISSPSFGGDTYRANEIIRVTAQFNTQVVVEGDLAMTFFLGFDGYNAEDTARQAAYLSGSGTDTLTFGYTVRPGDRDPWGIRIGSGTETTGFAGSGTIRDRAAQVERNPWYPGTRAQIGHKVDTEPSAVSWLGITSEPANGMAYAAGETVTVQVAFDEEVTSSGNPYVELNVGGVFRQALVRAGGYDHVLHFDYVVQAGDIDEDGIGIGANRLTRNGGGIYDSAGNAADLSHAAVAIESNQKVAAQ